jgi:tRNA(Ile)-lysidine synthase
MVRPRVEREVARQLEQHAMLPAGELGLVAVSGGADSVALLLALHALGCRLHVAHLDHGLRADSADDARFVAGLAARLELPCTIERREVARKGSVEAAGREIRYAFLNAVARREGAHAIFLGHTADDQVETFLLRLVRGAGIAGLSAMRPKDGLLCRPMLGLWRADVQGYLRGKGQAWREDATNRDRAFLRNRVRHELLPLLQSLNPGVKEVLLREVELLGQRQQELDAELLRRLGLSGRQIAPALAGKPVVLKGGWRLEPPQSSRAKPHEFDQRLGIPGMVELPGVGTVRAKAVPLLDGAVPAHSPGREQYVDLELVGPELRVRSRRPGDRFVPLGMSAPKKLQDFFVDEHVPREERDRVPLVTSGDAIVWVVGMRLDDRFKVTPSTTRAVRLQFEPADR